MGLCLVNKNMLHILAFVAAWLLGPRTGLQRQRDRFLLGNAQNSLVGLFMMWWAFLAFNSGRCERLAQFFNPCILFMPIIFSTFGVSKYKWNFSAKATVTTMNSSFGGGFFGLCVCYIFYRGKIKVGYVINSVFSSFVAITG